MFNKSPEVITILNIFLLQYKEPPHEYSLPDEIQGNRVKTVSVHTHTSSLKSRLSQAQLYSSLPSSFHAGLALCPDYLWSCPRPFQFHTQTTVVSCPNHSSLMPKPLQSHAQTTPVSYPNHSSLIPKPLQPSW